MLASQLALPREGHLDAVFQIFGYLKGHQNFLMVFDPTYPTTDMSMFQEHYWCDFYGETKEAIPPNTPDPRGKEVDLGFFDSDHAGDKLTRQSRNGYIIFLNDAPIGFPRSKQLLKLQCLEQNLFQGRLECKHSRDCNTSCA